MLQFDIRRLDIYRKIPRDLTQPTRTGAIISVATVTLCLYLLLAEFSLYLQPEIVSEVYVDDPVKSYEFIPVFLNLTLHRLPCSRVGLDAQDDMGRHDVGLVANTYKKELPDGAGCQMETSFRVAKVSGNFHISTHAADAAAAAAAAAAASTSSAGDGAQQQPINLAHTIHELSFGNSASEELRRAFQQVSSFTPLDNRSVPNSGDWEAHDYFLKIVPTIFDAARFRVFPFQFTALYRKVPSDQDGLGSQAAIWFRYEMAPIVVKYREHEKPFYHFLVQACAIIAGSFTVSGILDSVIFSASQLLVKARLGKLP